MTLSMSFFGINLQILVANDCIVLYIPSPVSRTTLRVALTNDSNLFKDEDMRQQQTFLMKPVHQAITLAILFGTGSAAMAQQAANKSDDGLKLEEVVVTATATARSKMTQSNSISTLDLEDIIKAAPTSGAEVLRSIPGVRSESSGGESNANVTVRGVPLSAGGARYVQFQEDGLPVLQFGDIAFSTPDSFLRVDNMLDRLEVVRGGSASTMGTNSAGGIINFISKTGEVEGGSIGISKGLNFDQTRYDFDYGGRISETLRFQVGGFYRDGEGLRKSGNLPLEEGGQIRANVTKELKDGYIRFNFKSLDDRAPTNLPVPVNVVNGSVQTVAGIDPRKASLYSPFFVNDVSIDKNNNQVRTNVNNGFEAKSTSLGFEGMLNLGNNWQAANRFKRAENSGRFVGIFPPGYGPAAANATFATGPRAGQAYTGQVIDAVVFNTSLDSMNLTANDFKLTKNLDMGESGKLSTTFGLYHSIQDLAMTWNFNSYALEMSGDAPALIQNGPVINNTPGLTRTSNGVNGTPLTFGGCCTRNYDMKYTTDSPYVALGWEFGQWNIDGSVRRDQIKATGSFNQAGANGYQENTRQFVNYENKDTSYSVGANYRVDRNLAVFGRVSEGVSFQADRVLFDGSLRYDGSVKIGVHEVKQLEGGVKYKSGPFSTFITVFNAKTDEAAAFQVTSQSFLQNSFEANGVEVEAAYRAGNFRVAGGVTYTDAEITGSSNAAEVGKRPRRQAKVVYQLNPSYLMGDVNVGAAIIGTTKAFGDNLNTMTIDGYVIVNPYVSYKLSDKTTLSLIGNNIFDKLAFTEIENGQAARALNGRSVRATLNYKF